MEKINAILAQETLSEADINFLIANQSSLPESGKVRLGLAPAPIEAVKEPVKPEVIETPVVKEVKTRVSRKIK